MLLPLPICQEFYYPVRENMDATLRHPATRKKNFFFLNVVPPVNQKDRGTSEA